MGTDRDPGDQKQPTSQPRDPKMQLAKVLLPDGVTKEFEVNVSEHFLNFFANNLITFLEITEKLRRRSTFPSSDS